MLVAVERDEIRPGDAIQHGRNFGQPCQIGIEIAADLELEVAVAVGGDDFFQRFRQIITDLSRMAANDVDQPTVWRAAMRLAGCQQREKARHVEAGQIL